MPNDKTKTGQGLITEVSDIQTHGDSGRQFVVVYVGGDKEQHKFSCWKPELFGELVQGASVEFKYTEKGKWRNIVSLESDGNGSQAGGNGQPTVSKDTAIIRESCIKSACRVVNTLEDDYDKAAQIVLTMAGIFEDWIRRTEKTEPEPPEEGE